MATRKKISDLQFITEGLSDEDEFLVIDTSRKDGPDAGDGGRTSKVTLSTLKDGLFPTGLPVGEKGEPGVFHNKILRT